MEVSVVPEQEKEGTDFVVSVTAPTEPKCRAALEKLAASLSSRPGGTPPRPPPPVDTATSA